MLTDKYLREVVLNAILAGRDTSASTMMSVVVVVVLILIWFSHIICQLVLSFYAFQSDSTWSNGSWNRRIIRLASSNRQLWLTGMPYYSPVWIVVFSHHNTRSIQCIETSQDIGRLCARDVASVSACRHRHERGRTRVHSSVGRTRVSWRSFVLQYHWCATSSRLLAPRRRVLAGSMVRSARSLTASWSAAAKLLYSWYVIFLQYVDCVDLWNIYSV